MAYLNIPMHKSHTARHQRRAVWLYGVLIALWFVSLWVVSTLWYTRDALSGHAPEGTVAVLHITPTPAAWKHLVADFGHVPLISGRFLTLGDVHTFAKGEFAVYLMQDGTTALGVRSSDQLLPSNTLDAYGISFQKVGNGLYILSKKPLPLSTRAQTHLSLLSLLPGVIGDVKTVQTSGDVTGPIRQTGTGYVLSTQKINAPSLNLSTLPKNTIAALSMPALPISDTKNITGEIDGLLEPLDLGTAEEVRQAMEEGGGEMILAANGNASDTLLKFPKPDSLDLRQWIKAISALKQAQFKKISLPDNSTADEMVIDPSSVVVEESQVAGLPVLQSELPDGGLILMAEKDGMAYVSTSEDLLNRTLAPSGTVLTSCVNSPTALLQPHMAQNYLLDGAQAYTSMSLATLSSAFSQIALSSGIFSQNVVLCR